MRTIEVQEYSPEWAKRFEHEAEELRAVFGPSLFDIQHIGSRAVEGLTAKPVIDILLVVDRITVADAVTSKLATLGYSAKGENGIPGRRYFVKGTGEHRSHHVHVFETGSEQVERHLVFRDYLRAHPAEARRYGELKARLAKERRKDPEGYQAGKEGLIAELSLKAVQWSSAERAELVDAAGPRDTPAGMS